MAKTFLCIAKETGRQVGTYGPTDGGPPAANEAHCFVDAASFPSFSLFDRFTALEPVDAQQPDGLWTGLPVAGSRPVNRRLTHADVLSLLTPVEWADMNRFHPSATGTSASGAPLNDVEVFWAVSVFNKASYVDLDDPRFQQVMGMLTAKGIVTPQRAAQLATQLAAAAASKGGSHEDVRAIL